MIANRFSSFDFVNSILYCIPMLCAIVGIQEWQLQEVQTLFKVETLFEAQTLFEIFWKYGILSEILRNDFRDRKAKQSGNPIDSRIILNCNEETRIKSFVMSCVRGEETTL